MTVQVDLLTLIITLVLVVIAAFLAPLLLQMRKTAHQAEGLIGELRRDLPSILQDLRATTDRVNRATTRLEVGSEQAAGLLESLGEIGDTIHNVNSFLRRDTTRYLGNAAGLWLGIRAASKVILKGLQQRGG